MSLHHTGSHVHLCELLQDRQHHLEVFDLALEGSVRVVLSEASWEFLATARECFDSFVHVA